MFAIHLMTYNPQHLRGTAQRKGIILHAPPPTILVESETEDPCRVRRSRHTRYWCSGNSDVSLGFSFYRSVPFLGLPLEKSWSFWRGGGEIFLYYKWGNETQRSWMNYLGSLRDKPRRARSDGTEWLTHCTLELGRCGSFQPGQVTWLF